MRTFVLNSRTPPWFTWRSGTASTLFLRWISAIFLFTARGAGVHFGFCRSCDDCAVLLGFLPLEAFSRARAPAPHRLKRRALLGLDGRDARPSIDLSGSRFLLEFQRDQFCVFLAHIGQGMGQAAFYPGAVAGLELKIGRDLAFDLAAQVQVGDRDYQMRTGVMVFG